MRGILILILLAAATARAQGDQPAMWAPLARSDVVYERTVGVSWFSPGGSWGDVTNRRVYLTGLRRSGLMGSTENVAIAWVTDFVPLAVVERTQPNSRECWFNDSGQFVCRLDRSNRIALGSGGTPAGVRLYVGNGRRWRAHATAAVGALLFLGEVPIYDSAPLNFSIEYGGGVEFGASNDRAFTAGFRFLHLSNAGIGRFNPGLDANVLYVGWVRRRAPRP